MKYLLLTALLCVGMFMNSCKEEVIPVTTGTTLIASVKTNITAKASDGWVYYSFDKDTLIDPANASGADWDIKFRYIPYDTTSAGIGPLVGIFTNSGPVFFNSGAVNKNGQTQAVLVDTTFDGVSDATKYTLKNDDTSLVNRLVPVALNGPTALFVYSGGPNHVVSVNPGKTFVVKTKSNKYVKMSITSIYKDAPLSPTYKTSFANFFTIRYVHGDGTRLK